ncbi:hypothetical protein BH23PLA1_BH23PLA1_01030 [soil metagenome]
MTPGARPAIRELDRLPVWVVGDRTPVSRRAWFVGPPDHGLASCWPERLEDLDVAGLAADCVGRRSRPDPTGAGRVGSATLLVRIDRQAGVAGPVRIELEGLPDGVSMAGEASTTGEELTILLEMAVRWRPTPLRSRFQRPCGSRG